MSHDTESMKAAARRTLEEIFPDVDEAALAEVVHPAMVNHDAPPDAPPGLDGMTWSMHTLAAAFSDGGVAAVGSRRAEAATWSGVRSPRPACRMRLPPAGSPVLGSAPHHALITPDHQVDGRPRTPTTASAGS